MDQEFTIQFENGTPFEQVLSAVKTDNYELAKSILEIDGIDKKVMLQGVVLDLIQTRPPQKLVDFFDNFNEAKTVFDVEDNSTFLESLEEKLIQSMYSEFTRAQDQISILFSDQGEFGVEIHTLDLLKKVLEMKVDEILAIEDLKQAQQKSFRFYKYLMTLPRKKELYEITQRLPDDRFSYGQKDIMNHFNIL